MAARPRPVLGNWKMHLTRAEARALATALRAALPAALPPGVEVAVAPPLTALAAVQEALAGSAIALCAQTLHHEAAGAFTGCIAGGQLRDAGCTWTLVGHSERRQHCGETPARTGRQLVAALSAGLRPVLCVGETAAERDAGAVDATVTGQLDAALADVPPAALATVAVAYEPVWAIGTGRGATPAQAAAVHLTLRRALVGRSAAGAAVPLLYGGSVRPELATALLAQPEVDGLLVGGASLQADAFAAIVRAAGQGQDGR